MSEKRRVKQHYTRKNDENGLNSEKITNEIGRLEEGEFNKTRFLKELIM